MRLTSILLILTTFFTLSKAYVEVTDQNFSELVQDTDEWILEFYADWCGFCKMLEPKFQAADRYIGMSTHKHVKLGVVNVETNPGLAARFFISRLPTLYHVKNHEVRAIRNPKHENELVSFVTMEEWRDVKPETGFMTPFSVFGRLVGFAGKVVKKASNYSPWTMIGVLTGFLIFALGLPIFFGRRYLKKDDKKDEDASKEEKTESTTTSKSSPNAALRRKSKRID